MDILVPGMFDSLDFRKTTFYSNEGQSVLPTAQVKKQLLLFT